MSPKNKILTSRDILFIVLVLWCIAPAVWLLLHISGYQFFDGLFGMYYNQPWQTTTAVIAAILLPLTAVAAIVTAAFGKTLRLITTKTMVMYMLLSLVVPLLLSSATLWFPIHFEHSREPLCSRGQYSAEVDCSYRLRIGF